VLHSFTFTDGSTPTGALVRDEAGNLYGTTQFGGNLNCSSGCGTVFKLETRDAETVIHSFTGADGESPLGNLIRDTDGNLYGTTFVGGVSGGG
jgi:uncharacterized repeat protein (TIGR03803 family)